ncbi:MAG TPA: response regulator transcription factor [Bacteroidia bacterium]|nr:response regulator transcription factor [Bacteroidia bacterium]
MLKIILFEDNKSLREMIFHLLNGTEGFMCVGAYPDASNLDFKIEKGEPDVVLMDIDLPGINGIEATRKIKNNFPAVQVLIQSVFAEDEKVFEAICAGASGYLLKNTAPIKLLEALQEVHDGGSPMSASIARKVLSAFQKEKSKNILTDFNLTDREIQVLEFMVQGMSYKMIADACSITLDGVRFHARNIYEKLHVHSKSEAIIKALKHKIV